MPARPRRDTVTTALGPVVTAGHEHRGPSWVAFAPAAVALYPHRPDGSTRNTWPARVAAVELVGRAPGSAGDGRGAQPGGARRRGHPGSVAALRLHPGAELWAGVKATEVSAYPA